jgi:hypothetical protein
VINIKKLWTIEGVGILKVVLEKNGFAEFQLKKKGSSWDLASGINNKSPINKPSEAP